MSTSAKSSSKGQLRQTSFWHRINIRFPWLKIVALIALVAIIVLDLLGFTISKISSPSTKISKAPMLQHAKITDWDPEGKKLVALTFDDGPSSTTTPRLLEVLADKNVPATFFVLGYKALNNPDLVRQIKNAGHEVGSHTMRHQNLTRVSSSGIKADLSESRNAIRSVLGCDPTLTRPPYGNYNSLVQDSAGTPLILWSVDTLDWKNKDPAQIVSIAMSQVYDGAIILMHDVYSTSVDAVPTLVDTLRNAGYEFVTVSDLAKRRNTKLYNGAAYYSFKP